MKFRISFLFLALLLGLLPSALDAQCTSEAGTIPQGTFNACDNSWYFVQNSGFNIDSGDVRLYIIHDGTSNTLGNILYSQTTASLFLPAAQLSPGTYEVAVLVGDSDMQGGIDLSDPCLDMTGGLSINLFEAPFFEPYGPITIGCGEEIELAPVLNPPGGNYQYDWDGPGIISSNVEPTVTINEPGWYFPWVTDENGCFAGDTIEVVSNGSFPTAFIENTSEDCMDPELTAQTNDPNNTYLWSTGETTQTIDAAPGTTYCVTVSDPNNQCTAQACQFVPNIQTPLEIEIDYYFWACDDSILMVANPTGGQWPYTFEWSNGSTSQIIEYPDAGTYVVTVTDWAGCTAVATYVLEVDADACGKIEGIVFADYDNNCLNDPGDLGMHSFTVRAEDGFGNEFFAFTDQDGSYQFFIPAGTYDVSVVLNNSPWAPCQASYSVVVVDDQTTVQDHPLQTDEACPAMEVDISTNLLRRCNTSLYWVSYCNNGTLEADDAYIVVTLDPFLEIISSSNNYTDLGNGQYQFDLGDLGINECGHFNIKVMVSCDADLGQTHCTEAVIYPNDPCPSADPNWTGASVQLIAECQTDEVLFYAKNIGSAGMTNNLEYVIIEDAVMLSAGQELPLQADETRLLYTVPANGSTWRVEAEQEPFHPGSDMPALSVEGCTTGMQFSTGFVNQFPTNDNNPWVDIDCTENVASFDPNDKQGFPRGYSQSHYIEQGTQLEYLIRFQNTGTDTAFLVVIRDELSQWLDPGSVRPGASSHPYAFDYYDGNKIKFTFENILLPDSSTNLEESQGFVSFKVNMVDNVPLETDILNTAGIYFDFNEPVYTNTTQHRIGDHFITVSTWNPVEAGIEMLAAPNPAVEYTVLSLKGFEPGTDTRLEIIDALGRIVRTENVNTRQHRLERGTLPAGHYLLRLSDRGRLLGTAKIMYH